VEDGSKVVAGQELFKLRLTEEGLAHIIVLRCVNYMFFFSVCCVIFQPFSADAVGWAIQMVFC